MAADTPEQSFKVTDRRRRGDDDAPQEIRPTPPREPSAREPTQRSTVSPVVETPPSAQGRDLTGLFVMFASSALIALGEAPDPLTGETHRDLAQATEAIDVLMLLRDRTEGNRTPEESEVLGQILHDLQVRFVRARTGRSG